MVASSLAFTIVPDSTADVFRYAVMLIGFFLCATNLAFIIKAEDIFPNKTCLFWRVFFIGKSLITGSSAFWLWQSDTALVFWRSPILLVGYAVSLAALVFAYVERPFEGVLLSEVVASDTETTIVKSTEV